MDSLLLPGQILAAVIVGKIVLNVLGTWLRKSFIIPKFTVSNDIPNLGKVRGGGRLAGQAVVCGGSVAGILAAAVLSNHYERVLIVEPEAWVSTEEGTNLQTKRETRLNEAGGYRDLVNKRSRVMSSTSLHVYLPALSPILHRLFPNFDKEVDELGLSSRVGDCDFSPHISGIPNPPKPAGYTGIPIIYITRATFEKLIRRCLFSSRSNVRQVVGTVTGVTRSPENSTFLDRVTIRTPEGSQVEEEAAIIIDCTGSTQAGLKWLQRLGVTLSPSMQLQYTPNIQYSTISFIIPPYLQCKLPIPGGWNRNGLIYYYVPNTDIEPRALILGVMENSILTIWCGGWDLDNPPRSISEFKTLAATLKGAEPVPEYVFDICDMLQEHIDEIDPAFVLKKLPPSVYTLYHKLSQVSGFPANYVAIGDAAMVVNPFFGQGCTKAGFGATTLDRILRISDPQIDGGFSTKFFKRQAEVLDGAWNMNKDADYAFESTIPIDGETREVGAFGRWFGRQLLKIIHKDATLYWTMWDARWLVLPMTDLMTPSILVRAVWAWLTV